MVTHETLSGDGAINILGYSEAIGADEPIRITQLSPHDASEMFDFITRNFEFLRGAWFPENAPLPTEERIRYNFENPPLGLMQFGIRRQRDEALVGRIELFFRDSSGKPALAEQATTAEVGFFVGKDFTRQGIAKRAVELLLSGIHSDFGINKFTGVVNANNPNKEYSTKTLTKAGFTLKNGGEISDSDRYFELEFKTATGVSEQPPVAA